MNITLARRAFKRQFGQANHFLVTSLVGLECLAEHKEFRPSIIHAVWTPKSIPTSIDRSRIFLMHSFLAWAVDAIDVYLSLLNRKPDYLQDSAFQNVLVGCGRSVYRKAKAFSTYVPCISVEAALVEVLITWRNNVMHEMADNAVSEQSRLTILEKATDISGGYCGLDPTDLCGKANDGADLAFKEVASLINAAHNFVEGVDRYLISKLNKTLFYASVLEDTLRDKNTKAGFRSSILNLNSSDWPRIVSNWLSNRFAVTQPVADESLREIRQAILLIKRGAEAGN